MPYATDAPNNATEVHKHIRTHTSAFSGKYQRSTRLCPVHLKLAMHNLSWKWEMSSSCQHSFVPQSFWVKSSSNWPSDAKILSIYCGHSYICWEPLIQTKQWKYSHCWIVNSLYSYCSLQPMSNEKDRRMFWYIYSQCWLWCALPSAELPECPSLLHTFTSFINTALLPLETSVTPSLWQRKGDRFYAGIFNPTQGTKKLHKQEGVCARVCFVGETV